eukprot:SAG31_NODE_34_length_31842_cov_31.677850_21_plen_71_part_00
MEVHELLQSKVKFELEALSTWRSQQGLASYVTRRLDLARSSTFCRDRSPVKQSFCRIVKYSNPIPGTRGI